MKTIKTSELSGAALDWAVAKCEGFTNLRVGVFSGDLIMDPPRVEYGAIEFSELCYSTDWAQGGPIIEREKITITPLFFMEGGWRANHHNLRYDDMGEYINGSDGMQDGPTPLIAAMRCFCASRLGDEVEIPKELMK